MQFRSALWKNNLGSFCSATTRLKVEAQGSNSLRNDEAMLCKCGESINMCHRNSHLSGLPIIIVLFHACVEDNLISPIVGRYVVVAVYWWDWVVQLNRPTLYFPIRHSARSSGRYARVATDCSLGIESLLQIVLITVENTLWQLWTVKQGQERMLAAFPHDFAQQLQAEGVAWQLFLIRKGHDHHANCLHT